MKALLKQILKYIPIAFTQNQVYDAQTKKVIKRVCKADTQTVDVGCHKGEILDLILAQSTKGKHFGFEPIPALYNDLVIKYKNNSRVSILPYALSDKKGESEFNYVVSNPAYSGLKKRKYDKPNEQDTIIKVPVEKLDDIIDEAVPIHFIKIDVEGGELGVLKGAVRLLTAYKPIIIFEHGIGGSDFYGTSPKDIYNLLTPLGYKISLMQYWLQHKPHFSLADFELQFYNRLNYYFIAYP